MVARGGLRRRNGRNGKRPRHGERSAPVTSTVVVDVGNTKVAYGVFRRGRLVRHGTLSRPPSTALAARRSLAAALRRHDLVANGWSSALASVVPAATTRWARALRDLTGERPLVLGSDAVPGFRVRVPEPATVGPDRLANALGALAGHGAPAIVVDLGTATSFDVVNGRGEFVGGAIAPGLAVSAAALFAGAARLRPIPIRSPHRALGRTTSEAIRSGLVLGHAGLVDGMVERLRRTLGSGVRVIATGGLAALVAPHAKTIHGVDPVLTLRGLYEAHRRRTGGGA